MKSLGITRLLGAYFTLFQAIEYFEATFSIAESTYGSTFFIATGFHGLHVIVGTIFLLVSLVRLNRGILRISHHFGFVRAI
jgi:cytochrome c oxidase subunit 3